MLRGKVLHFLSVLILAGLMTGCSYYARYDLARGRRLESQGQTEKALEAYMGVLQQARDRHLRSLAYFRMGECLWGMNRNVEALRAFEKAAEIDNSNALAHLRLGEIYLSAGAADRAAEQAHAVLQVTSTNIEGLALLGAASSAVGNNSLAEFAFNRVLAADPGRVSVAVALAEIYNNRDDASSARTVLQKAAASQPRSSLPWMALGRLEEQEGNPEAAESAYRRAVSTEDTAETNLRLAQFLQRSARMNEAEAVLRRVDSLRPSLPVAVSDFLLLSGAPAAALDRYTTVLRSPLMERTERKSTLWNLLHEPSGKYADDIARQRASVAARVIESDLQLAATAEKEDPTAAPNTAIARLHLSEYEHELDSATVSILKTEIAVTERDLAAASSYAEKAVAQAPDSAAAHYTRGLVSYVGGHASAARDHWLHALENDSNYVPARLALAEQALTADDARAAEQYVVVVVRQEPGNFRALNLFGRVLLAQKRYAAASLIARRAAIVDTDSAEPHVLMGTIAMAQDHVGTALGEFEQAITIEPRSESALEGLTRVYRRGKITKPMLAEVERVAENPPLSAPLMEIAGRIYAEHGWFEDARRCLNRALAVDPGRTTAASVLAALQASRGDYSTALQSGTKAGGPEAALLKGSQAEQRRDFGTAIREYDAAVKQGEQSGVAANNLAWLLSKERGSLDRALEMARRAASLAPDNPLILDTLGYVQLQRREYSNSIAVLKQAAQLANQKGIPAEELAVIRRHLSEAYFRAGDNEQANAVLTPNSAPELNSQH